MKFNGLKAAIMLAGITIASTALAAPSQYYEEATIDNQRVNAPFRFDYVVSGPDAARPIQVYSDGYETFFEFEKGVKPSYAIIGDEKVKFKYAKPYYSIAGEYSEMTVRTTRGKIEVERRDNSQQANSVSTRYSHQGVASKENQAPMSSSASPSSQGEASPRSSAPVILPAGKMLSQALGDYVRAHGWNLKWGVEYDYMIEQPIPMQPDFFGAIYDLVKTYQEQGGLLGAIPRFAGSNQVVSIEKLDNTER